MLITYIILYKQLKPIKIRRTNYEQGTKNNNNEDL